MCRVFTLLRGINLPYKSAKNLRTDHESELHFEKLDHPHWARLQSRVGEVFKGSAGRKRSAATAKHHTPSIQLESRHCSHIVSVFTTTDGETRLALERPTEGR